MVYYVPSARVFEGYVLKCCTRDFPDKLMLQQKSLGIVMTNSSTG